MTNIIEIKDWTKKKEDDVAEREFQTFRKDFIFIMGTLRENNARIGDNDFVEVCSDIDYEIYQELKSDGYVPAVDELYKIMQFITQTNFKEIDYEGFDL